MLFAVRPRHPAKTLATLLGAMGLIVAPAFAGPPFRTDDPVPVAGLFETARRLRRLVAAVAHCNSVGNCCKGRNGN